MSTKFNLIESDKEDGKPLQIYEYEFPPERPVYGIDGTESDKNFRNRYLKLRDYFYTIPTALGSDLKINPEDGYPYWIMASEMSPEDQAKAIYPDRGEAIAAYILLVLHTNQTQPSDGLVESMIDKGQSYGEIVAFDIRDKYLSYEIIEALKKRAEYILWKHNIQENNKYRFIS